MSTLSVSSAPTTSGAAPPTSASTPSPTRSSRPPTPARPSTASAGPGRPPWPRKESSSILRRIEPLGAAPVRHEPPLPAMDDVRLVPCPDRSALAAETGRFVSAGLIAVVLGPGPAGHFAFNQPPTPVAAPARVVDLAPANLPRLGPVAPARSALTLGVTTVLAAGSVLVIAAGAGKAQALDRLLHG